VVLALQDLALGGFGAFVGVGGMMGWIFPATLIRPSATFSRYRERRDKADEFALGACR
jgi:hypothetical protein